MPATYETPAPLRTDVSIAAAAALFTASTWGLVHGGLAAGLLALVPGSAFPALALPIALSTLRRNRPVAAGAYASAALLSPLTSYWARFPYLIGQVPPPLHLTAADLLSGLPCAAFGLLLLRRPRPAGGVPGPLLILDAAQAVVAACVIGILLSALARGGQFGIGYFSASLALLAGLTKASLVQGAVAAAASLVIARDRRSPRHLAAAAAFALLAGLPAWYPSGDSGWAWCAGFALTILAGAPRAGRTARAAYLPAPLPATA